MYDLINSFKAKGSPTTKIPNYVYKRVSHIISPVISNLFNNCLINGIFPSCLKVARVIAIFKSGSRNSVNNYRPISTLPFLSKLFEKLMYNRVTHFLDNHRVLYDNQYGFRLNRSTSDAVLRFLDFTYNALEDEKRLFRRFWIYQKLLIPLTMGYYLLSYITLDLGVSC